MSTSSSLELAELRANCDHQIVGGYFQRAIDTLLPLSQDSSLSSTTRVELFTVLARAFVTAGHIGSAAACFNDARELLPSGAEVSKAFKLQETFTKILSSPYRCDIADTLDVHSGLLQNEIDVSEESDDSYQILVHYVKILRMNLTLNGQNTTTADEQILNRIIPLAYRAIDRSQWYLALKLVFAALPSMEATAKVSFLADILDRSPTNTTIPKDVDGRLRLEAAEMFIELQQKDAAERSLEMADECFRQCDHPFGTEEVRRLRILQASGGYHENANSLVVLIQSHIARAYPIGALRCSLALIDSAYSNGDLNTFFNIQRVLDGICDGASIVVERLVSKIKLLTMLRTMTGKDGDTIQLGLNLFEQCQLYGLSPHSFLIAQTLSSTYTGLDDLVQGDRWAETAYHLSGGDNGEHKSMAAYNKGLTLAQIKVSSNEADSCNRWRSAIDFLEPWTVRDIDNMRYENACNKLSLMASTYFKLARVRNQGDSQDFALGLATTERVMSTAKMMDDPKAVLRSTGSCRQEKVTSLLQVGKLQASSDLEADAVEISSQLITDYQNSNMLFQSATSQQIRGLCYMQMWRKPSRNPKYLADAEADFVSSLDIFQQTANVGPAATSHYWLAYIHYSAWLSSYITDESIVLDTLGGAESTKSGIRRGLIAIGGLEALMEMQKMSSDPAMINIYDWATRVCISTQKYADLWQWSQKRKARSLCNSLGLGILVPQSLIERLQRDTTATSLVKREETLRSELEVAATEDKAMLRNDLEGLYTEMACNPLTSELAGLRDGSGTGLKDLDGLFDGLVDRQLNRNATLVDWTIVGNDIHMLTVSRKPDISVRYYKIDLSLSIVRQVVLKYLGDADACKDCMIRDDVYDAEAPLRVLDALIAPISTCTDVGDLLVLSPTDILHSIPLHALRIPLGSDQEHGTLIDRNPLIYSSSSSILQKCLLKASEPRPKPSRASDVAFLSVFDATDSNLDRQLKKQQEQKSIYTAVDEMASLFHSTATCGPQLTKASIPSIIQDAAVIHFHGHCEFEVSNPLKQALVISGPEPKLASKDETMHKPLGETATLVQQKSSQTSLPLEDVEHLLSTLDIKDPKTETDADTRADTNPIPADDPTHLTVAEVFDIPLSSPHVTLIACESASQAISSAEEPLGLMTGLLCAGATSVIGTRWKIPSKTGRQFSRTFYESIRDAGREGSAYIDLAVSLQKAVQTLKDDDDWRAANTPWHWAGFVLYGSWKMRSVYSGLDETESA